MRQQQGVRREKAFDLPAASLRVAYQPLLRTHDTRLSAALLLTPRRQLANAPVEVELRGYSHIQSMGRSRSSHSPHSPLHLTDDLLNASDQKLEINVLMGESKKFEEEARTRTLDDMNEEEQRDGEYFLEGCNVLYQIDEATGERLEALQGGREYHYPIDFSLPIRLPSSVDHIVLADIHIAIRYTLEVKLILVDRSTGRRECQALIIPFEIQEGRRQYPYEELVVREQVRCYHAEGKRRDEVMRRPMARFIHCLCPRFLYDSYLLRQHHFRSSFEYYDIFHVELVAVVNQGHNIFLIARAYQEPEAHSLTLNREKGDNKPVVIKEVNSLGEVPNDISLVSMKQTERKNTGLCVQRVEVEMLGELAGIAQRSIFKKTITLSQSNYDMVEGEAMVDLTDHMSFLRSCTNELFTLRYYFNLRPLFEEEEVQGPRPVLNFQHFVVESTKKDLPL